MSNEILLKFQNMTLIVRHINNHEHFHGICSSIIGFCMSLFGYYKTGACYKILADIFEWET